MYLIVFVPVGKFYFFYLSSGIVILSVLWCILLVRLSLDVLGRIIYLLIYFQHFFHLVLTFLFYLAFCILFEFLQNFSIFFGLLEYTYTYFELFVWVFTSLSLEAMVRSIILEKFSDLGFPCSCISVLGLLHCDLLQYLDLFFK